MKRITVSSVVVRRSMAVVIQGECPKNVTVLSLSLTRRCSSSITNGVHNDSSSSTTNGYGTMDQFKDRLARSALKQVETHGWTKEAITAAAVEDPKVSISIAGMLTPTELVHWFMDDMNRQLRDRRNAATETAVTTRTTEDIFQDIQWRLRQVIPLVKCGQWHKGMALGLTTPLTTQKQLHQLIEIISPPHSSTEYQTALGGIFVATELHLLTDSSPEYCDTWTFLQNRLDELERNKDHPPTQFLSSLLSSRSINPIDTNIPIMASMAVASSLMEGLASLVLPTGTRSSVLPGTRPSDYQYSGSNDTSSRRSTK
ncbi:coenzyme Q9 COQ9 [Nitzschia inconspicua]|uniref:Ubiquinone biosynthesis protein n=1 Tax=Nitzschia inconspicua TaxID=303405 RepID=A0A9K3PTW0_9STRA|nr:coenzyme Q9 COQ9 [Nitzschia inconspicua]KAG7359532.1 coenzyme Q9 COQ9 [Nitzschia inconspicua]